MLWRGITCVLTRPPPGLEQGSNLHLHRENMQNKIDIHAARLIDQNKIDIHAARLIDQNRKLTSASAAASTVLWPSASTCKIHHFDTEFLVFDTQFLVLIQNSSFLIQSSSFLRTRCSGRSLRSVAATLVPCSSKYTQNRPKSVANRSQNSRETAVNCENQWKIARDIQPPAPAPSAPATAR